MSGRSRTDAPAPGSSPVVELTSLVDGQKIGAGTVLALVLGLLVLLSDGYDLAAIGYVGPELVREWHVARADLVPVLSAGIVGLFVGAPLFGFIGDRLGRKTAILAGLALFGFVTLATMAATTLGQITALRFVTGIGLGGVIPNIVALIAEIVPKRVRGRCLVIINFGVPAGIALPGLVANTLVPSQGWPVLLLVGGLLPLAVAVLVLALLPESIKYLARRGDREERVRQLARAMRPDLAIGPQTRLVTAAHAVQPGGATGRAGSPAQLFAGSLAIITPLLWVALAANQMVNFFSISWLPTLLQSAGHSTAAAGSLGAMFSVGGLVGGVVLLFLVDRLGVVPMVALFFVGVPLVAAIGNTEMDPGWYRLVIAGAGFCVTGINFNMTMTHGMVYPTPVRSMGAGWAQAMGRIGSLAAPLVGGWLLAMQLPMQELLYAPAITLGIGAIAAVALALMCYRRFGGTRLDDVSAEETRVRAEVAA